MVGLALKRQHCFDARDKHQLEAGKSVMWLIFETRFSELASSLLVMKAGQTTPASMPPRKPEDGGKMQPTVHVLLSVG